MKSNKQKVGQIQTIILVIITGVPMVVCGIGAYVWALTYLMTLGGKYRGNYEYYGQTPAIYLIFVAGALGFATPGLIAWNLRKKPFPGRFRLRTMLTCFTVVALLIGVVSVLYQLAN